MRYYKGDGVCNEILYCAGKNASMFLNRIKVHKLTDEEKRIKINIYNQKRYVPVSRVPVSQK